MSGLLIVMSGPSGVGKSTICRELVSRQSGLKISTSMTTRPPRHGEVDGESYFFVTENEFKKRIDEGFFLEWARIYGYYYGTPYDKVKQSLEEGWNVLLEIDVQGALQVREMFEEAVLIFVSPPSVEDLEKRIKERGTEEGGVIEERLRVAHEELKAYHRYDYMVVNGELGEVVNQVSSIIVAEQCRVSRL